uniref:Probable pectate lyase F n=1 Tax=Ditylenchus dipsaci TaxID=166011 RepID=A0A915DH45_9BILA
MHKNKFLKVAMYSFYPLFLMTVSMAICNFELVSAGVNCNPTFPTAKGSQVVQATISVAKNIDYGMKRLTAGSKVGGSSINENDQPILILEPGVTVSNLIIGNPASKGIWCKGSCTLKNVWWEAVGTHAAGLGTDSKYWANTGNKYIIQGGGVQNAADKVFIQQGAGTTYISDFYARNMSKLWRSCGNCPTQFKNRKLVLTNTVLNGPALTVVGLNANLGDGVSVSGLSLCNSKKIAYICQGYQGTTDYNPATGTGPKPTQQKISK